MNSFSFPVALELQLVAHELMYLDDRMVVPIYSDEFCRLNKEVLIPFRFFIFRTKL